MEHQKRLEFVKEVTAEDVERFVANLGVPAVELRVVQSCESRRVLTVYRLVPIEQEAA